MINKLENVLKELNIELAYQEYDGKSNEYIIYDIYDLRDNNFADDVNLTCTYYITMNYWHKSLDKIKNYKPIIKHMKNNGFYFVNMKTLNKSNNFFGKNFIFKIDCMEE